MYTFYVGKELKKQLIVVALMLMEGEPQFAIVSVPRAPSNWFLYAK